MRQVESSDANERVQVATISVEVDEEDSKQMELNDKSRDENENENENENKNENENSPGEQSIGKLQQVKAKLATSRQETIKEASTHIRSGQTKSKTIEQQRQLAKSHQSSPIVGGANLAKRRNCAKLASNQLVAVGGQTRRRNRRTQSEQVRKLKMQPTAEGRPPEEPLSAARNGQLAGELANSSPRLKRRKGDCDGTEDDDHEDEGNEEDEEEDDGAGNMHEDGHDRESKSRRVCSVGHANKHCKPSGGEPNIPEPTNKQANICAACSKPIKERYLLQALDKQWHEDCLKCACCDCRLGEVGSSLFTHSDKILCRRDFLRIFGQDGRCAACKKSIPPYELVMRAQENAYHMDCFACQLCQYRFCVGDRFHLTETHRIVCVLCHSETQHSHQYQQPQPHQQHQTQLQPQTQSQSQTQIATHPNDYPMGLTRERNLHQLATEHRLSSSAPSLPVQSSQQRQQVDQQGRAESPATFQLAQSGAGKPLPGTPIQQAPRQACAR